MLSQPLLAISGIVYIPDSTKVESPIDRLSPEQIVEEIGERI